MSHKFPIGTHPLENELNLKVLSVAKEAGYSVYLVGGYVRDALLYKNIEQVKDLDYAVLPKAGETKSAMQLARLLADKYAGHYVPLDAESDTARVVFDDGDSLDLAGCVLGSIENDIRRRDFSINALVWNPEDPDVINNLADGIKDVETRTIRALSEKAFEEDPLRILRAFRFAATIGGVIEEQTLNWIAKHLEKLNSVAVERINYELFRTFAVPKCATTVLQMAECGVLETVFPELKETRKVTPNAFHHLGLFEHSIDTIPQLETKLDEVNAWVIQKADEELSFGVSRLAATKLACILHDIGKPATWAITDEGRHTFYGHDKLGADMCEVIADRMKWAHSVEKFIVNLVRWHLRPGALFHQGPPTDKAVRRFYRSIGVDVPELMLLVFGDFGATRGPGLMGENRAGHEKSLFDLLEGYPEYIEESRHREKLLNGGEIMHILSLKPGPIVGELLAALDEAHEFKEVTNRSDAERFVKTLYAEKYSK